MSWEAGDRRRLVIATVVTVVALPFLWTSKRDSPETPSDGVAAITPGNGLGGTSVTEVEASDVAASTPAYLEGSELSVPPQTVAINVPADDEVPDATGNATFRRFDPDLYGGEPRPCWSDQAPFDARIVVTNTENGFKIACINKRTNPLPPDLVIVIDTATFGDLADLTEAPIPVELNW